MSSDAVGRRERKRAETRGKLVEAALHLFAVHGYISTTVEDITEAADVAKGTFFNYFESKEEVLLAFGSAMRAGIEPIIDRSIRSSCSVRETIDELIKNILGASWRGAALTKSLLIAILSNEKLHRMWLEGEQEVLKMFTKLYRYGQARGEIRTDIRPGELALRARQTVFGALLFWTLYQPSELHEWVVPSLEIFWSAISVSPNPKSAKSGARK